MATVTEPAEAGPVWFQVGSEGWQNFTPVAGQILEFGTVSIGLDTTTGGHGALLVTGSDTSDSSGPFVSGRFVGGDSEEANAELSSLINRREHRVHTCGADPCTYGGDAALVHVVHARLWDASVFNEAYMKTWGKKVISDFLKERSEGGDGLAALTRRRKNPEGKKETPLRKPALRPAGTSRRRVKTDRPDAAGELSRADRSRRREKKEDRKLKGVLSREALRGKLAEFRDRASGRGRGAGVKKGIKEERLPKGADAGSAEEEESGTASTEEDSSCVLEEPPTPLGSGTKLTPRLALMDRPHEENIDVRKRQDKRRSSAASAKPEAQLLAVAVQQRDRKEAIQERSPKRSRGDSRGKESEKKRRKKRRKRKKEEKNRKRRKKKKRGDGGSSGGSSSSTSTSGRKSRSRSTRGSEESSDSSLLAPLQRKSRHNPGGVLKMLIKHARQLMDQDSAVDLGEDAGLLGGVRMTSYFSLMLRPYHSTSSRDMKELYLLATTIDQLRQGKLGALGDALASRFIAIQTAMTEGNWRSAQYLEMHPLDAGSPAPVPLLLEARKHAKLIDKSQRQEDFRGYWRNADRSSWTYEDPPKGKGKKGKQGKGKGKGRGNWSQYQGGWDSGKGGGDWWSTRKEDRDKADKTANPKKDGEKEK